MKLSEITLAKVQLKQVSAPLPDVAAKVREEFAHIRGQFRPGMSVAITCGSRGISNIALVIKTIAECLKEAGCEPFVIPAMGSHAGATAEGQKAFIEGYGVTEEYVGAPIKSSMEVVKLGSIEDPVHLNVYMDKYAWESDGVIAVNRVKVHTDFHGAHESGIVKMLTIGLGKHAQALQVHHYGADGLRDYIPLVSQKVIESGKVLGAFALLEDGYDATADVRAALPEEIFAVDSEFLERSRETYAKLPFDTIDTLIVDEMGKEISGTGMDTNVIGRVKIAGQKDFGPFVRRLAVLGLTEASHGNALGVGLADITTARLRDQIDWKPTNENVITSGFLDRGHLPVVAETDRDACALALRTCGIDVDENFRMARIANTLHLGEVYLTRPLVEELVTKGLAESVGEYAPLDFSDDGRIAPF